MSKQVHIELSEAEALLVFEGLSKLTDKQSLDETLGNEMLAALSALICELEKKLPVFASNYSDLVERAKLELRFEE